MLRLLLFLIPIVCFAQVSPEWQNDLDSLNQQIEQLTDEQEQLRAKATWHQDQGDRWQFEQDNLSDARRAWSQADQERQQADALQPQIDALQQQRVRLLQQQLESQGS